MPILTEFPAVRQPPHPAAMMPPEQLAEKVMMLQRLQMRRQDLANELARMDAGIRRELRTLPPQDFIPPETLDPKSAYALRALQVTPGLNLASTDCHFRDNVEFPRWGVIFWGRLVPFFGQALIASTICSGSAAETGRDASRR